MRPRRLTRLATLTICAAVAQAAPAQAQGDREAGHDLARRLCASCHMNEGQGEKLSPTAIPGFQAVADRPGQSPEGIVSWLRSVPASMPNHHLSQQEMQDLATFIVSLRQAGQRAR